MIRNKKYAGLIWAMIIWCLFYGTIMLSNYIFEGTAVYISNIIIKILFCSASVLAVSKIYGRKPAEVFSSDRSLQALFSGIGYIIFLIYFIVLIISGVDSLKNNSYLNTIMTVFSFTASVLFEEILFRCLILEGYYSCENKGWKTAAVYSAVNFAVYGAVHISGGNAVYSFLLNGTIGLSVSVIYIKTRNIIIPILLQIIYCILAFVQNSCEWNGSDLLIRLLSVYYFFISVMGVLSAVMILKDDPDIHKMLNMKRDDTV